MSGTISTAIRPFQVPQPWIILATPSFDTLANDLIAKLPDGCAVRGSVSWKKFPDRTPNIVIDAESIQGRDVVLIAEIDMGDIMSYFSVVYAIPRYFARTFLVVTPFFPTGTMERVEVDGEVATAMTLCRMMSAAPNPTVGSTCFMHFDIHALATRFFFHDTVKPILTTAMPLFLKYLDTHFSAAQNQSKQPAMIVFPDDGAKKRFKSIFGDSMDLAVCSKTRVGDQRKLVLQEGDPSGRDCIIVDDMVQSGGTMLECVSLLHSAGAVSVSCYVTHGVFPNDSWQRFTNEGMTKEGRVPLRVFLLTDGIPATTNKIRNVAPFHILSLADRLAELLESPCSPLISTFGGHSA